MAEDFVQVSVSTSVKVTNPKDRYENTTFSRTFTRRVSVRPRPDDEDQQEAYEAYISATEDELSAKLRDKVETELQEEIDQFYEDNGVTD